MSEPSIQQVLGVPSDVTCGGKVYKFGPANQEVLAEQEKAFAAMAKAGIKAVTPAEEWAEELDAHRDRVARRHYAAGSKGWAQMMLSPDGWAVVYLTMFRVNHPEIKDETVRAIEAENPDGLLDAIAEQLPDFFAQAFPKYPADAREKAVTTAVAGLKMAMAKGKAEPNGTQP